ncbi:FUSC family protein [Burkholderia cenocepacia]|uniref:FUSC family protein n=1 Tax=Burkholderia cenocepacia TaxID=95486 RepID=UPI000F59220A|nr:FUSC family protein [Burkholderia cenocepacia]RQU96524.1 FUSC family protein [Burkholderia cenocepacia]
MKAVAGMPAGSRRAVSWNSSIMSAVSLSRAIDRLFIVDPGLHRLLGGARAALASLLAGAFGIASALHLGLAITTGAVGILFSMIAPLFLRDAHRLDWYESLAWQYGTACASFAAAACVSAWPAVGKAGFVIVLFCSMLCQTRGPRTIGCAFLAIAMYYLGLYLHPAALQAGHMLAMSIAGPASVVLVCRVLLPVHAAPTPRLIARSVSLHAACIARSDVSDAGALDAMAHLLALNEAAIALEHHASIRDEGGAHALHTALVALEIASARRVLNRDRTDAAAAGLRAAIARFESVADGLAVRMTAAPPRALPRPARAVPWAAGWRTLAWLPAIRAAAAACAAMLIGETLSSERWMWAVLSTFVVFFGTYSCADTIYRGAQRVAGTLAGALASVLVVGAAHHANALVVIVMGVCVFGWAYHILHAYGRGVFFLTVLIGLVYAQLGFEIGALAELRIGEVLIGCAVSLAAALLVMPLAASRHIATRSHGLLAALRELVHDRDDGMRPGASQMRAADRRFHDVRMAIRPLAAWRMLGASGDARRLSDTLLLCWLYGRIVATRQPVEAGGPDVAFERPARAAVVTRIDALMSDLDRSRSMRLDAAASVGHGTLAVAGDPPLPTHRELARLDAKLTELNRAFEDALFGKRTGEERSHRADGSALAPDVREAIRCSGI